MAWDDADIQRAISEHPAEAAAALGAVQFQLGLIPPLTADALAVAAMGGDMSVEALWIDQLEKRGLYAAFVEALLARGIALDGAPDPDALVEEGNLDLAAAHVNIERLAGFTPRAKAFRCRLQVNNEFVGSGCLIGPSLVLTAWHVIAIAPPGQPQQPFPSVTVELSDGSTHEAYLPARYESFSGDGEYAKIAPRTDIDVAGRNDVALISLRRPVGSHLGYAQLPPQAPMTTSRSAMFLLHFPNGTDPGLGSGRTSKIRNVTARWKHDIPTQPGSSGGACFNRDLELAGLHQGKWPGGGRLVPLSQFIDELRPLVEQDITPKRLWSMNESPDDTLVIGRDLFLETLAAAGEANGRVRGLRVKRRDLQAGTTGLAFSYDILQWMLTRRGGDHLLVRVPLDDVTVDLAESIQRRVADIGLVLPQRQAALGVARGQATTEAVAKELAGGLAAALNEAVAPSQRTVWFFFDHPTGVLSETNRLILEGFVAGALNQPRLRVVVTGFETWSLPGQEFAAPSAASGLGPPGLVVEYIGGFRGDDIRNMLASAEQDLTGQINPMIIDTITDRVLQDLPSFNGVYRDQDLPAVIDALRPDLRLFLRQGKDR